METFVMVDIQEKFEPVISDINEVIKNAKILVKASKILKIPLIVTEQYPKGLGKTIKDIGYRGKIIEKTTFSCMDSPIFRKKMDDVDTVILFGIETHVCVFKTALQLKHSGIRVLVVTDATSSRSLENKRIALKRMQQENIRLTTTEMVLFELIKDSKSKEFQKIKKLIK